MDENAFPYAILEATLARFFLPEGDILPFRARLKNLQRLGLTPSSPGKGNHQSYSYSDLCDYALAMMLAEFGLEPRRIVSQVKRGEAATREDKERGMFCVYLPEWLSKGFSHTAFVNGTQLVQMVLSSPRLASINISDMKWKLRADLLGIIAERIKDDGSP